MNTNLQNEIIMLKDQIVNLELSKNQEIISFSEVFCFSELNIIF